MDDETRWNVLMRGSHTAQEGAGGAEWWLDTEERIISALPSSLPWRNGWFYALSLLPWGDRHEDIR